MKNIHSLEGLYRLPKLRGYDRKELTISIKEVEFTDGSFGLHNVLIISNLDNEIIEQVYLDVSQTIE